MSQKLKLLLYWKKKISLDIIQGRESEPERDKGTEKEQSVKKRGSSNRRETGHSVIEQRRAERWWDYLTLAESDFLLSKLLHAVKNFKKKRIERETQVEFYCWRQHPCQPIQFFISFYSNPQLEQKPGSAICHIYETPIPAPLWQSKSRCCQRINMHLMDFLGIFFSSLAVQVATLCKTHSTS